MELLKPLIALIINAVLTIGFICMGFSYAGVIPTVLIVMGIIMTQKK